MPLVELKKYGAVFLKNNSPSDDRQVPAPGALYDAFRQGATCLESVEIQPASEYDLQVANTGRIRPMDNLFINTEIQARLGVVVIVNESSIRVRNASSESVTLIAGNRLVPIGGRPLLWGDARQNILVGPTGRVTTDANGRVAFYVSETRFDAVLWGGGVVPTLLQDEEGGWQRGAAGWVSARDFPSVQAAVDALPSSGGTVYLPEGHYSSSSTIVLPAGRPIRIVGQSPETTKLVSSSSSVDVIQLQGDWQQIEDLTIEGSGGAGVGRGVVIGRSPLFAGDVLKHAALVNLRVRNTPSYGIHALGISDQAGALSIHCQVQNVWCTGNIQDGLVKIGNGCVAYTFDNCNFVEYRGACVTLDNAHDITFRDCTFEGSKDDASASVTLFACQGVLLSRCHFEQRLGNHSQFFLRLIGACIGCGVEYARFERNSASPRIMELVVVTVAQSGLRFWPRGITLLAVHGVVNGNPMANPQVVFSDPDPPPGSTNATELMVLGTGWLRDESDSLGQTYYPIQIGAARENVWLQSQRIQLPPVGNMTGLTNVADGQIAFSDGKLYLRSAGSWVELATAT